MGASKKQGAIEQEFGEPFFDVIVGFAKMGYGKDTVAKILEYDASTFRQMLKRYGWYEAIPWPAYADQVVWKDRGPLPKATIEKIRAKALERQAKIRKERLESGWRPVRVKPYHNL